MEKKGTWLLSLILILGLSMLLEGVPPLPPDCHCDIDVSKRTNCGPPGVTPEQCRNNGCCFSSKVPGVPWCFKPLRKVCPQNVRVRKNCGYPGIPANKCEERGCCFEDNPPAVPWCFYHILEEGGC